MPSYPFSIRRSVISILLLLGLYIVASALYWVWQIHTPMSSTRQNISYHFAPGTTVKKLVADLQRLGVLDNPRVFLRYVEFNGLERRLQAGMYAIDSQENIKAFVHRLTTGDVINYAFTIIEGWTLQDLLQAMRQRSEFNAVLTGKDFLEMTHLLSLRDDNPEGLFLPETYFYHYGLSDKAFLLNAHKALLSYCLKSWEQRDLGLPYRDWYDGLIVASLIEKETPLDNERELIAGVIVNRLRQRMPLQIDAAVIYGLGADYEGDLKKRDLRHPTAYNTYTEKGLPPTPIALPSRRAIHAALHPQITPYLYFVARGDGGHYFSKTLDEHNLAVEKYIIEPLHKPKKKVPSVGA